MMRAPSCSSTSCVNPFTVAAVPTGMNAGVSNAPCGVENLPRRAPVGSVWVTSNAKLTLEVYQHPKHDPKAWRGLFAPQPVIKAQPTFTTTYAAQIEKAMA